MAKDHPKVSVLMPVFNGEKYICEAIDSILNQTFTDFELVIVDDGSTDNSVSVIESYNDKRIKLYYNGKNKGLSFTRNRCIEVATGTYLAILDCDDIAKSTRLEEQMSFLIQNPEYGMVGSRFEYIDSQGVNIGFSHDYNEPSENIPSILLFNNYFAQSSLMIQRKALPDEWYREGFPPAEDYDLWVRISQKWKIWNLPKVLIAYRLHQANISKTKADAMIAAEKKILDWQLNELQVSFTEEEFEVCFSLCKYNFQNNPNYLTKVKACLFKLKTANKRLKKYDENIFNKKLDTFMYLALSYYRSRVFNRANEYNLSLLNDFYLSPFSHHQIYNNKFQILFSLRCLMGWKRKNRE